MIATECLIHSYVHQGRIGVLVELAAQTDFATRSNEFQEFAHSIALHIAASSPRTIPALLGQPYVKDNALTVGELLGQLSAGFESK